MTIRIRDSVSRQRVPLEPLCPGEVGIYVCGPTVYDDCHIGHLMGPVVFDTVARWMLARGLKVRFVNNITDIDDKIIDRAKASGELWSDIAERYTQQYLRFLEELSVTTVTDHPRCTEYVPQMIRFIEELVEEDRAYESENGVYYDVFKQEGYGKLSGRKVEDMIAGARVGVSEGLRHPVDFALWKKAKPGEPSWDSPWGPGRPGWHIECSVMSSELLGRSFDIHGGGDDLKFPHHENEIAQSEARGDGYARIWMHHGLIQYEGKKIAKSDPRMQDESFSRQFQGRWLLDQHGAPAVRFFLVRTPYGRPVDFGPGALEGARKGLVRLHKLLGERMEQPAGLGLEELLAAPLGEQAAAHRAAFCEAMDDDFNSGEAIAQLFSLAALARGQDDEEREQSLLLMRDLGRLVGLFLPGDAAALSAPGRDGVHAELVDQLLKVRGSARDGRDFETADGVRDLLVGAGIEVQDSSGGAAWEATGTQGDLLETLLNGALELRQAARERGEYSAADSIRGALESAGIEVHDGPEGPAWELK